MGFLVISVDSAAAVVERNELIRSNGKLLLPTDSAVDGMEERKQLACAQRVCCSHASVGED